MLLTTPMSSKILTALLIVSGDTLYLPAKTERPNNTESSCISPVYILFAISNAIFGILASYSFYPLFFPNTKFMLKIYNLNNTIV